MSTSMLVGGSMTSGVARRAHALVVRSGDLELFRGDVIPSAPTATLTLRGEAEALPAAVVGEVTSLFEARVELSSASLSVRLGDELFIEANAGLLGKGMLRIWRASARDLQSHVAHETYDVSFSNAESRQESHVRGGWVRSDRLGFALCHVDLRARIEALEKGAAPLAFLTKNERADELTNEGWVVPFLGIRPLWPFRVLQVAGTSSLGLPLGQRVSTTRHVTLAEGTRRVVMGESLWTAEDVFEGELDLTPGRMTMETYVAGGEVATFLFRPDEGPAQPANPIVNVDVHSAWKDVGVEALSRV